MFEVHDGSDRRSVRGFASVFAALSLVALILTAWILFDVRREQEIVARIVHHLPESDLAVAKELSIDLRLQRGLSALLVLNVIGTAIAFVLMIRGYLSSEQSLRDVKVLATDILASMDAGVITTNRDGIVTSMNPRGRELTESVERGVGMALADLNDEHALLHSICNEVLAHHNCIRDRDYVVTSYGHQQTLRAGCTLLKNQRNDELGTVIHVRDVSEKALMEERLRRMERYMGLGSLAAGLHHEIKNPLSALSLHIQLLCERFAQEPHDAEVDELLDVLHTEVRRISDVLDGFRSYASFTELGRSPIDVRELIEKLIRLLRPQATQQNIELEMQFPAESLDPIPADSVRLEQVFLNLALNGMSAMPRGGTLTIRVDKQDEMLAIFVIDTGHGVPPEIQSQIFDPYFTTRPNGTGMGLALSDKIIRQHDGRIEFRTSPSGTEFTVLLPLNGRT